MKEGMICSFWVKFFSDSVPSSEIPKYLCDSAIVIGMSFKVLIVRVDLIKLYGSCAKKLSESGGWTQEQTSGGMCLV